MTQEELREQYDRALFEDEYDEEKEEYLRNKREFEESHPFFHSDFI